MSVISIIFQNTKEFISVLMLKKITLPFPLTFHSTTDNVLSIVSLIFNVYFLVCHALLYNINGQYFTEASINKYKFFSMRDLRKLSIRED